MPAPSPDGRSTATAGEAAAAEALNGVIGASESAGPYHQVLGEGCVYPAAVPTLGNQLSAAGRSWAAYLQDMGNDPGWDNTVSTARGPACGHPATWSADRTRHTERAISTPPAMTGLRSSARSPRTRPSSHPNVPLPGKTGPGGGRIGAVLLSPLIRPGTVSTIPYNHYSLLRAIEDIFGLPYLGDAAMPQVRSFGADVFD